MTIATAPDLHHVHASDLPAELLKLIDDDGTGISWTDLTLNAWIGCTKISPGCKHCYAEAMATNRMGRDVWGPGKPRPETGYWRTALRRWNAAADRAGVSLRVFVGSMKDIFEAEAPKQVQAELLASVERHLWLDFLLTTKRPERAPELLPEHWRERPPENAWLLGSLTVRDEVTGIVSAVRAAPVAVRALSMEPLLEDVFDDLERELDRPGPALDWLIVGGESAGIGKARPFDEAWAHRAVAIGRDRGIAVWFKQYGSHAARRKLLGGKGDEPAKWPAALRVQEHPRPRRRRAEQVALAV